MRILPDGAPPRSDIITAARTGSGEALGGLFAEHANDLLRVAFRLTASQADAEDIVQDVFVGLPEALRHYDERGSLSAWLKRVTVRCALMRMRSEARRYETPLALAPEPIVQVSDHASRLGIERALATLTPALRAVFVLHEVEGYTHVEIGELLGIRTGTSEVRLFRARLAARAVGGLIVAFRNVPGLHPRAITLHRYADRTLGGAAMRRVGVHVIGCARCRAKVGGIQRLGEAVRASSVATVSPSMMDQVLARRAAGERVILPAADGHVSAPRTRWRVLAAAGVVIAVGAAALANSNSATAAGDDSQLTFSTPHPRQGASLVAEYRPSERFAGHSDLFLRARFVSGGGVSTGRVTRPSRAERFAMRRDADGVFRLSFALPADVVLASFAVEDSLAEHVDTHRGRLWELLAHDVDDRPRYDALVAATQRRARWESRYLASQALVDWYPDSAAGWASRAFTDQVANGRTDSATVVLYRQAFERFHLAARQARHPSSSQMETLYWMALRLEDSVRMRYWTQRLMVEAPRSPGAVQMRASAAIEAVGALSLAQPALERLWQEVGQVDGSFTTFGLQSAMAAKDPHAILRWGRRYLDMERDAPGSVRWVARALIEHPDTRGEALRMLRATLAPVDLVNDQRRPLSQTVTERQRELDKSRSESLQLIGEGLLADGQHAAALDSLLRAARAGWNAPGYRDVATAALRAGDTTIALRMLALVALDPGASPTFTDSARRMLGASVSDSAWRVSVAQSERIMHERVLASAVRKPLRGDRIRLLTSAGKERTFSELAEGHITVVAFGMDVRQSRSPVDRDVTQRLASFLTQHGARLVVISLYPHAPDVPTLMRKHAIPFEVYFDEHKEANRAFNAYGFPLYFVVDAAGVIRFEFSEVADLPIQVRVLAGEAR